jgi:hypothetical protein
MVAVADGHSVRFERSHDGFPDLIVTLGLKNKAFFSKFNWHSTFFGIWLNTEGAKEKVLQFKMQLKSIYKKNLGFIEWKMYFWKLRRGLDNKKSINRHYFCHEKNPNDLFRAALYRLTQNHCTIILHSIVANTLGNRHIKLICVTWYQYRVPLCWVSWRHPDPNLLIF